MIKTKPKVGYFRFQMNNQNQIETQTEVKFVQAPLTDSVTTNLNLEFSARSSSNGESELRRLISSQYELGPWLNLTFSTCFSTHLL